MQCPKRRPHSAPSYWIRRLWMTAGVSPLLVLIPTGLAIPTPSTQPTVSPHLTSSLTHRIQFSQPNTDEASDPQDRPQGGGARFPCPSQDCAAIPLTAVVPQTSEPQSAWGQTITAIPTFWFYLPYPAEHIDHLAFELWSSDGTLIIQEQLAQVPNRPGLIGYRPPITSELTIGETYRWYLLVSFDPKSPSKDAYITGRVKRITPPPTLTTARLDLLKQAQILAAAGVWYDTVDLLARLSPQHPQYLRSLLKQTGLAHLSQAPILMN